MTVTMSESTPEARYSPFIRSSVADDEYTITFKLTVTRKQIAGFRLAKM
jgi:hypothetical protein